VVYSQGIPLKKKFGQHFLRDSHIVRSMIFAVEITANTSIFEIGCGDGFLTRAILDTSVARLFVFEIDPEWAQYVKTSLPDPRLKVMQENFLEIDFTILEEFKPWTVLSNLPYQVTFPILHTFQEQRHLIKEGVVMVQEEVAQKIMKQKGKGYGFSSLFFQHYFEWKLLDKIPPTAFYPPPKVFSRLLYFKPRKNVTFIPDEDKFWQFVKFCFKQPRRTLKNNLMQSHFSLQNISSEILMLRAQELSFQQLLEVWLLVNS